MLRDKQLLLSDAQAVTATADSTNVIDQGAFGDADGGKELNLAISVGATAAASSTSAAVVTITLNTSADNGVADSYTAFDNILWTSPAYTVAQLTANTVLRQFQLPRNMKRYFKLIYTVATENLTAGVFNANLVANVDTAANAAYKA